MKASSMQRAHPGSAERWFRSVSVAVILSACGGAPVAPESPTRPQSEPEATTQPGAEQKQQDAPAPAPSAAPAAAPADLLEDEAAAEDSAPRTLREALAALERAEAELGGALTPPAAAGAASELSRKARSSDCGRICQALGSLERAALAICELTAPNDERCRSALESARRNHERTASCGC